MPANLSASGMTRASKCPPAYALPQVRFDSAGAARGRARHAAIAEIAAGRDPMQSEAVQSELLNLTRSEYDAAVREIQGIDPRMIPPGECEVAMAYDVQTGKARRIGGQNRDYSTQYGEIPGTADFIAWGLNPLVVIDWKGIHAAADDHRDQLELYALMAARLADVDDVECRVVGVSDDGKFGLFKSWQLDFEDLGRIAKNAYKTWRSVEGARKALASGQALDVTVGKHCQYCPAQPHCPGHRAVVQAITHGDVSINELYYKLRDTEKACEKARTVLKLHLEQNQRIDLPDGEYLTLDSRGHMKVRKAG